MSRLASLLLALSLLTLPAFAIVDIPAPASLPEKKTNGDSDPSYPAECARRLLAGKAFLEAGELEKAREEFAQAEKADSGEPWVFFYKAILDYRLGDYPTALRRADNGIGALRDVFTYGNPDDNTRAQMTRFTELRDAIQAKLDANGGKAVPNPLEQKQKFEAALKEGDEAYSKGLLAKAASAYERAYRADPTQAEIGLRAASLYADRLKKPREAAALWQQVIAGGEPHATTARAELQAHHDILESVLQEGLGRREQWRRSGDPAEARRYAEAFPDNTVLQVELAVIYSRKTDIEIFIGHLQNASRLGLTAEEFLAEKAFTDYFEKYTPDSAPGRPLASFIRDAYGEDTLGKIRTELQRRADETARVAREKAEKERQAKLAAQRKELSTWRDARRSEVVREADRIIGARNDIDVEMAPVQPGKKKPTQRLTVMRHNSLSFGDGKYLLKLWQRTTTIRLSTGVASPTAEEELFSLPSFAAFREIKTWPSSWEPQPVRLGEPGSAIFNLPADPGYRALGREVRLYFNLPGNIRHQMQVTYEYETADGSTGYGSTSDSNSEVSIQAMLQEAEIARLKGLFEKLARLDAAGSDVDKLQQLRMNWAAWN